MESAVKEVLGVKMLVKLNLIVMYATMFFFAVKNFERKRNVMYVQVYHWQKWHFFIFFITAKSDV